MNPENQKIKPLKKCWVCVLNIRGELRAVLATASGSKKSSIERWDRDKIPPKWEEYEKEGLGQCIQVDISFNPVKK